MTDPLFLLHYITLLDSLFNTYEIFSIPEKQISMTSVFRMDGWMDANGWMDGY